MSCSDGTPIPSPHSSNLMKWVDQQAVRLPVPSKMIEVSLGIASATSQACPEAPQNSLAKPTFERCLTNAKPKVYDIATLYVLGREALRKNTELKVHTTSLKENIWKSGASNGNAKNYERNRVRASSDESEQTQRSLGSGEEIVLGHNLGDIARPPYRQPIPAPEELHDQKKDGFKRFLKEVASPPHHRVTAGGRIVPTGTQSPPIMRQYDSLDDSIQPRQARHKFSVKITSRPENLSSNALTLYGKVHTRNEAQGKASSNGQPYLFRPQAETVSIQPNGKIEHDGSFNQQMPLNYPIATSAMQLRSPETTGAIAPFTSGHFLGHWNGFPVYNQLLPVTPYPYSEHTIPMYGQPYSYVPGMLPALGRNPSVDSSGIEKSDHLTSLIALPEESLVKKREEYTVKLSDLDKHVALNLHKFTVNQNARNAARREELVKTIDLLRVAIETSNKSAALSSTHAIEQIQSSEKAQYVSQQYKIPSPEGQRNEVVHGTGSQKNSTCATSQAGSNRTSTAVQSTALSAIAPPFIPSNLKDDLVNLSYEENPPITRQPRPTSASTTDCNRDSPLTVLHSSSASPVDSGGQVNNHDNKTTNSGDGANDNRVRSPFAAPEVDLRDILYVDRLGLNPSRHEKMFCSTVEEFQEVIRRAREQATTYSCTPGASKDPAHDAEEDIRCAMQNEEAIVLPKPIPDHIANPRPWNWSDSAYNARAHQEFAPFLPAEKMQSPLRSAGSSSRWNNSLHPILEENPVDEGGYGQIVGVMQSTTHESRDSNHRPLHMHRTNLSSGQIGESPLAQAQTPMAPITESKAMYDDYTNGKDVWGLTKVQDWKHIGAPEVKIPCGKNTLGPLWRRASPHVQKKNESTFLQGMLRFPKFCRQNGTPMPSDAEVLAQQLKFEEISAIQRTRKENVKLGVAGERGVNAKDVFEAARAAFFPKAEVSVGPSYQNALGIVPPPNQRGSPLNRVGNHLASSTARAQGVVHSISPLRVASGQSETVTSIPPGFSEAAHKRQDSADRLRKMSSNRPVNLVA